MRLNSRGQIAAMFGLVLLGVVGCGQDNESAVKQQAAATSGTAVQSAPQPKTQAEYGKQQQQQSQKSAYKASGYPGAK